VFKQDGSLVLPTGFREWVFLGGPVTPNALNNGKALFPEFHNVYVEPENYRYFQQHGMFPEGTVLVKELVLTETGNYPDGSADSASGRGYFPSSLHGLDVMVKDSKRFGDTHDWGFFSFGHQAPPYQPMASVKSAGECAYCHIAGVAKTDMVWVQYYPSLTTKIK
jgi:cytochrome P460